VIAVHNEIAIPNGGLVHALSSLESDVPMVCAPRHADRSTSAWHLDGPCVAVRCSGQSTRTGEKGSPGILGATARGQGDRYNRHRDFDLCDFRGQMPKKRPDPSTCRQPSPYVALRHSETAGLGQAFPGRGASVKPKMRFRNGRPGEKNAAAILIAAAQRIPAFALGQSGQQPET
jgi:hypothetical protein